jgi:hypothetical protein
MDHEGNGWHTKRVTHLLSNDTKIDARIGACRPRRNFRQAAAPTAPACFAD